jgi:hypothetical protein
MTVRSFDASGLAEYSTITIARPHEIRPGNWTVRGPHFFQGAFRFRASSSWRCSAVLAIFSPQIDGRIQSLSISEISPADRVGVTTAASGFLDIDTDAPAAP